MTLDVQTKVEGGTVNINCRVDGYTPEEIKVSVEGDDLVIQAEHKSDVSGQKVHKSFSRRITLPKDTIKETVCCNLDDKGQLSVVAQLPRQEKSPKCLKSVPIPVSFK